MQLLLPYVSGHSGHRFDRTADSWNLLALAGKHGPQLICIRYGEQQCMQLRPYIFQGRFVSKLCLSRNSWLAMLRKRRRRKKGRPHICLLHHKSQKMIIFHHPSTPFMMNAMKVCSVQFSRSRIACTTFVWTFCFCCVSLSLRLLSQYLLFFVCFYLALLTPF